MELIWSTGALKVYSLLRFKISCVDGRWQRLNTNVKVQSGSCSRSFGGGLLLKFG